MTDFRRYRLVDTDTGNFIEMWGDSSGGIQFRVGDRGSNHHLDEIPELQGRLLATIFDYYIELKAGFDLNKIKEIQ